MELYQAFYNASTTIHILTGFAFLCLGVSEAISSQNINHKFKKFIPGIFFLTGLLSFVFLLYYNAFNLNKMKENFSIFPSFYILNAITFIFMAYGISLFLEDLKNVFFWKFINVLFSFFLVFLYLFFSYRIASDIRKESFIVHLTLALPLFLAFLSKIFEYKFEVKKVKKIASILFLIAAFQLITYKEIESSYRYYSDKEQIQENKPKHNEIQNTSKKGTINRPVNKSKKKS